MLTGPPPKIHGTRDILAKSPDAMPNGGMHAKGTYKLGVKPDSRVRGCRHRKARRPEGQSRITATAPHD